MGFSISLLIALTLGVARAFVPVAMPASTFMPGSRRSAALYTAPSDVAGGKHHASTEMKIAIVTVRTFGIYHLE